MSTLLSFIDYVDSAICHRLCRFCCLPVVDYIDSAMSSTTSTLLCRRLRRLYYLSVVDSVDSAIFPSPTPSTMISAVLQFRCSDSATSESVSWRLWWSSICSAMNLRIVVLGGR
ncbi:hypothetical protein Scep_009705 [Stephania cephalantha]|uniref:Uncharacterized protein n=1 Tax=Stephania cephalantha TaxID=152367 RepID=A0AAP0JUC4_9MAGN